MMLLSSNYNADLKLPSVGTFELRICIIIVTDLNVGGEDIPVGQF